MIGLLAALSTDRSFIQTPLLLQPVWKTEGKYLKLTDNCLDAFIWSNAAFLNFISQVASSEGATSITRQSRTVVWIYKMLFDVARTGKFDHKNVIDTMSYNTKNDKAFASNGRVTNSFMSCERLVNPRVKKAEIKLIILGGGQNLLSPERRFDAVLCNSPELFL